MSLENHSIEVGVGPKTTHWIPCFFAICKVTSQGGRAQFWLIRDQSLFISGGGVCRFWLSRKKMNLIWFPLLIVMISLPPPPINGSLLTVDFLYNPPMYSVDDNWSTLSFPRKSCDPSQKNFIRMLPSPPPTSAINNYWCLSEYPKEKGVSSINILSGVLTVVDLRSIPFPFIIYLWTISKYTVSGFVCSQRWWTRWCWIIWHG